MTARTPAVEVLAKWQEVHGCTPDIRCDDSPVVKCTCRKQLAALTSSGLHIEADGEVKGNAELVRRLNERAAQALKYADNAAHSGYAEISRQHEAMARDWTDAALALTPTPRKT